MSTSLSFLTSGWLLLIWLGWCRKYRSKPRISSSRAQAGLREATGANYGMHGSKGQALLREERLGGLSRLLLLSHLYPSLLSSRSDVGETFWRDATLACFDLNDLLTFLLGPACSLSSCKFSTSGGPPTLQTCVTRAASTCRCQTGPLF